MKRQLMLSTEISMDANITEISMDANIKELRNKEKKQNSTKRK